MENHTYIAITFNYIQLIYSYKLNIKEQVDIIISKTEPGTANIIPRIIIIYSVIIQY